jgi:hypothetical protein
MCDKKLCSHQSKTLLTPAKTAKSESGEFHKSFLKELIIVAISTLILMVTAAVIIDEALKVVGKPTISVAGENENPLK